MDVSIRSKTPIEETALLLSDGQLERRDVPVPPGNVESRIRQLNTITSKDNLTVQESPNNRLTGHDIVRRGQGLQEGSQSCSPACRRARLEVSASPPVGHSYPGLRIDESHSAEDHRVGWEVVSTSSHGFQARHNLRASRSSVSIGRERPAKSYHKPHNLQKSDDRVTDISTPNKIPRSGSPLRSRATHQSPSLNQQVSEPLLTTSTKSQQDPLDIFDTYGVSRPEGLLAGNIERQSAFPKAVQICHSCGNFPQSRSRCARCGHQFCFKCKSEVNADESTTTEYGRGDNLGKKTLTNNSEGTQRRGMSHSTEGQLTDHDSQIEGLQNPVQATNGLQLSDSNNPSSSSKYTSQGTAKKSLRNRPTTSMISVSGGKVAGREMDDDADSELFKVEAQTASKGGWRMKKKTRNEPCQRLLRSYSDLQHLQNCSDCPTCYTRTSLRRHCICCAARQSISRRRTFGGNNAVEKHHNWPLERGSTEQWAGANNGTGKDMEKGTTSQLTSNIPPKRASPNHQIERDGMMGGKGTAGKHRLGDDMTIERREGSSDHNLGEDLKALTPSSLRTHSIRSDEMAVDINQRRAHDITYDLRDMRQINPRLHDLEQDVFWLPPMVKSPERLATKSNPLLDETDETPKLVIEGIDLLDESTDISGSVADIPRKVVPKTPPSSRRISMSTERTTKRPHRKSRSPVERANDGAQRLSQTDPRSRLRKFDNGKTKTPTRSSQISPWARESLRKVEASAQALQREAETADFSDWKQRLRNVESLNNSRREFVKSPTFVNSNERIASYQSPMAAHRHVGGKSKACLFCSPNPSSRQDVGQQLSVHGQHIAESYNEVAGSSRTIDSLEPLRVNVTQIMQGQPLSRGATGNQGNLMTVTNEGHQDFIKGTDGSESFDAQRAQADEESRKTAESASDHKSPGNHHKCEWKSRYISLSSDFERLKTSMEVLKAQPIDQPNGEPGSSRQHATAATAATAATPFDNYEIEGLTIIVHRRYKEDLVLNTDLREDLTRACE